MKQLGNIKSKPEFHQLVKAVVMDVWTERVINHNQDQTTVERRISELRNEKKTLLEQKRKNPSLYTDDEFLEQKHYLDNQVNQLEAERTDEIELNNDFEDVVEKAFVYLCQPVKAWERLDIRSKTEFQRAIFKNGLPFDGEEFGTAKISLLVEILQASSAQKSHLVRGVGVEPT